MRHFWTDLKQHNGIYHAIITKNWNKTLHFRNTLACEGRFDMVQLVEPSIATEVSQVLAASLLALAATSAALLLLPLPLSLQLPLPLLICLPSRCLHGASFTLLLFLHHILSHHCRLPHCCLQCSSASTAVFSEQHHFMLLFPLYSAPFTSI